MNANKDTIFNLINLGRQREKHDIYQDYCYIDRERLEFIWKYLFDGKLKIRLPKMFIDMPEEFAKLKYPSSLRPAIIKTNMRTDTNFCFNYFTSDKGTMDVNIMATKYKEATIRLNRSIEIMSYESKKDCPLVVDDNLFVKDIAYYDYITPTLTENVYNLQFFCFIEGHMLHSFFNCLEPQWEFWKDTALEVFNSTHQRLINT